MAPTETEPPLTAPLLSEAENAEPPMPKGSWRRELRAIFALAAPCIVTTCSSQTMVVTDQVFVGHLGVTELAAAALGNTYFNLLWFFLLGCSTALDTLGSQAFGANDASSLLTWTYASLVVLSGLCGVMAVGLWYGREVAVYLFFQGPEVAELVGVFCRWLIPGLWPMMWSVVAMKFMQTQNVMLPPAIVAAATCVFNVASNALFIHYLGFKGAPMATSFSRFVQVFVYVIVLVRLQHHHHPGGWGRWLARSRRCWAKALSPQILGAFLSLGIPGGCMLALEAGSFDITTAFAGALGQVQVSAHSTLLGVCTYTFISFPFAVATAATIRVGNLLGAGRAQQASLAATLCVLSGTIFQGTCGVIMFAARHYLGYLFTSDPEVAGLVARIAIFGVAFQFFDGAFGTSQGVLRGMGRQHQLMAFNLIGFWGSGVAFGWWLTFRTSLGLKGLWIGIDTGDFVAAALCVLTWLLVNWRKEVKKALDRMAVSHDHEADLGHVAGEADDWHDFLVPVKHHAGGGPLAAGNSQDNSGHGSDNTSQAAGHPHPAAGSSAAVAIGGGGGGGDPAKDPANDPFSEVLLAPGAGRNPYGSPRFASPRFRGA